MPGDVQALLMQPSGFGERFWAARNLPGPTSYITGGVLVNATVFGLLSSLAMVLHEDTSASGTYVVRVYRTGTGTNVSTVLVKWYTLSATNTYTEVANATNLSAERMRFLVFGN